MTELELYKFVSENNCEYHWRDDEVHLFVSIYLIEEFNKMLGWQIMSEYGIDCNMRDKYFAFDMSDICEYFNIDMNNVFTDKNA